VRRLESETVFQQTCRSRSQLPLSGGCLRLTWWIFLAIKLHY